MGRLTLNILLSFARLIEDGTYRSAVEIAEAEGVTRSFVTACCG
jgi:hypothetical protein